MSDRDLAFFVLLARQENFTKAGQELGVSASAVSRKLVRLEDRLSVRLFNRTTRGVSLTGEGEEYFSKAVSILSEIDALENSLSSAREIPTGLLRVNATLGFSRVHLAPAISAFKQLYPKVKVQLVLSDTPLNLVAEGMDIGIRFGSLPDSQLIMRRLLRNRRFLCAAPSYLERYGIPNSLIELRGHNCIVLRQDHDAYDIWRFDEINNDIPTAKVEGDLSTNDGEIALDWVLNGNGIMLRSEWNIAPYVREGRLRIVLPKYLQTAHVSAVFPERHNLSAKVRLFVDFLVARLREAGQTKPLGLLEEEIRG